MNRFNKIIISIYVLLSLLMITHASFASQDVKDKQAILEKVAKIQMPFIVYANVPILGVPDLVLLDLTTNIANPDPGDIIDIAWIVENQGGADSPATTIQYYISTDDLLDDADTYLGSGEVPAIAAGGSATGVTNDVRIPPTTPPGDYYLIGSVTPVLGEMSTTNNVFAIFIGGCIMPAASITAAYVQGILTLNVSLNPGDYVGMPADWFLIAATPLPVPINFSYNFAAASWTPGISPALPVGTPLASVTDTVVTTVTIPPIGKYTFFFGVDLTPNGTVDLGTAYYDSDTLTP